MKNVNKNVNKRIRIKILPVFELLRTPPLVFVVVKLGTGVALATEARGFLAGFGFVVCQDIGCVQPFWIIVQQAPLLVEAVRSYDGIGGGLAVLDGGELANVVDGWPEIVVAVGKSTMGPIFHAEPSVVGVVDAHSRLVIFEMVPSLRVSSGPMQILTTEKSVKTFVRN